MWLICVLMNLLLVSTNAEEGSRPCIFPFEYRGYKYTSCTTANDNSGKPWCAINIQNGEEMKPQSGKWAWCHSNGKTASRPCRFPFKYKGIQFTHCTYADASSKWCSLETDSNGN